MERTVISDRNTGVNRQQPNALVRVRDLLFLCLKHWAWFLISLSITMGCAVYYLLKTPKTYTCSASILFKSNDGKSGAEKQLEELGLHPTSSNMTNELLSLNTTAISAEIVRRLALEVDYFHKGTFHPQVAYGLNLPIKVEFKSLNDNETVTFRLELKRDSSIVIKDMIYNGNELAGMWKARLGQTFRTPAGKIQVQPSPYYKAGTSDNLEVNRRAFNSIAASVKGRVSASLQNKNSTIINIKYRDVSVERAKDVLSTLIVVYNENWVKDRNQITVSTSDFIKERLGVIEQELGDVEQDISNYKSKNLVPDVQQVGSIAISQSTEAEQQTRQLDNQLYMVRYVRGYLLDNHQSDQLLPTTGIANTNIMQQIGEYNEVLLKRNKHLAVSSLQNPLVKDLNQNLATIRNTIIHSLDNEIAMLQAQRQVIQATHNKATAKIAANPQQAKYLLSVERQQKVKESLYLFLLQKREENELSQAFTAYNTRLIEPPHLGGGSTEPVGTSILFIAFAVGLAIPCAMLFVHENLNTTIRGRKDLEQVKVPFVGEIPQARTGKKGKKGKGKKQQPPQVLVAEKNRNIMNEAFRVVRTNLEFIHGFDNEHHIVMLTSMQAGSGKTFITINLSTALGIKEKKVLAIDLDLRKASLSEYVGKPQKGISNYLSGQETDYHSLIVRQGPVDVLPCGTIPPNPTELLFSPRFASLLAELRTEYDYILIDCPPAEVVADTTIINRHVDLTLFVVRAHLMEREYLSDVEQWYEEKKYNNMSVILNGTTSYGKYGYRKYGYSRYGYDYGYGEKKKTQS